MFLMVRESRTEPTSVEEDISHDPLGWKDGQITYGRHLGFGRGMKKKPGLVFFLGVGGVGGEIGQRSQTAPPRVDFEAAGRGQDDIFVDDVDEVVLVKVI